MSKVILNITDVFQVEGRGTIVTGVIGPAWESAKVSDPIVLRSPAGAQISTSIKEFDLFRPPLWKMASNYGALLLLDLASKEQLPPGSLAVRCETVV